MPGASSRNTAPSTRLTADQRHRLLHAAADRRDYFGRLRDRMKATGWPADDPLFVAVCRAWDAAQEVVKLAYDPARRPDEPPPPADWMRHMGPTDGGR